MSLDFFDHTAVSLEALFSEAALTFTTTVTDLTRLEPAENRSITLRAPDLDQRLVDWLNELVGLFDIEQFLVRAANVSIWDRSKDNPDWHVEATLAGE